jgi:hypothetical protein
MIPDGIPRFENAFGTFIKHIWTFIKHNIRSDLAIILLLFMATRIKELPGMIKNAFWGIVASTLLAIVLLLSIVFVRTLPHILAWVVLSVGGVCMGFAYLLRFYDPTCPPCTRCGKPLVSSYDISVPNPMGGNLAILSGRSCKWCGFHREGGNILHEEVYDAFTNKVCKAWTHNTILFEFLTTHPSLVTNMRGFIDWWIRNGSRYNRDMNKLFGDGEFIAYLPPDDRATQLKAITDYLQETGLK